MIEFYVSSSGADRLGCAKTFVESCASGTEVVIVGATREAADDVARELAMSRRATFGLHRFSLMQFVSHLATPVMAEEGLAPATPLGSEAVTARVVFDAVQQGEFETFAPVAKLPGFPRALAATLTDLRAARVSSIPLRALPLPGRELGFALEALENQLRDARLVDRAATFEIATRVLQDRSGASLASHPVLLLDIPIRTRAERQFIEALATVSPRVLATVPVGDERTERSLRRLEATVTTCHPPASEALQGTSGRSLTLLAQRLFSEETLTPSPVGGDVHVFSAPGEGREANEIARRIHGAARRGVRFDEMAILLRAPEVYWGLLEHALKRAHVPAYYSRGTRRPDPSGRAFLALLACAAERLSAQRFAEYLSLGQVPPLSDSGGPPASVAPWVPPQEETLAAAARLAEPALLAPVPQRLPFDDPEPASDSSTPVVEARMPSSAPAFEGTLRAPWKWELLLVESAVIRGKERWARRLEGLANEWHLQIEDLRREDPESPLLGRLARDLTNLGHLQRFALPVVDRLAALPSSGTWAEWLRALEDLAPQVLRSPDRVLTTLAELRPMGAIGPVSIDEVRAVLSERLRTIPIDPPAERFGRVFVGTPDQVRGRAFKVVFIPGLAERVFPQRHREDPLLLDALRTTLSDDLELQDDRRLDERLRLRIAVGAATDEVHVSYPRLDVAIGRPRVPSFYALDVIRAISGEVPDPEGFEQDAAGQGGAWLAWPAPLDAMQSLDNAEHDLAMLRRWLRPTADERLREEESPRGRARYLFDLNPHLARALRSRWARWSEIWGASDGLLATGATRERLAAYRLTARPYSASALQRYAACPYRFLLGSIHRLEPFEIPTALERLDPLTKGALFHEVQRDVLRALAARSLFPIETNGLPVAFEVLDETLDRVAAGYQEKLAPAIDKLWEDEVVGLRSDLRVWLRSLARDAGGWVPRYFEFSFGLPLDGDHDPASLRDPVMIDGRFQLRGAVDLIEERRDTADLRITDHKTGKNRTQDYFILGGGEWLQPVLYAMAIGQALDRRVQISRLSFCTAAGDFSERRVNIEQNAERHGLDVLEIIDRAIEEGTLLARPRAGACTYCDYRVVCGPAEEHRVSRKQARGRTSKSWLYDLDKLREMR